MTIDEKRKYALEEINRLLIYIDNFYWILSSFWMAGTGFAISKALDWKGKNERILGLSVIVIVTWILFLFFTKHTFKLSLHYLKLANDYENKLSLDILPKEPIGGMRFMFIMKIVSVLSIVVMCWFFIEYLINK